LFTYVNLLQIYHVYICKICFDYICKMNITDIDLINDWYDLNYQHKIIGRWVRTAQILPLIKELSPFFEVNKIGESFLKNDIYKISFGKGKRKILIWSQMHGNESTGTKALFDLFKFFETNAVKNRLVADILKECTIVCIPILNPDGAEAYTRVNAEEIDLNRDVIDKKAVESTILQDILIEENPEYCFNLHDQRTIFSVGKENNPATISFLAPSVDKERSITKGRIQTMKVIMDMNNVLQNYIPGHIGRYTDEFYSTATGDNFQKMGHNTILIESGHFKDDYQREKTRKYTFLSLFIGIQSISKPSSNDNIDAYFEIPCNDKNYYDIIVKSVSFQGKKVDIGILFEEKIVNSKLQFIARLDKIKNLSKYNANKLIQKPNLRFSNKKELKKWINSEFN